MYTPVGIWCQNDVASTLIRRHFYAMCPLDTSCFSELFSKRREKVPSFFVSLRKETISKRAFSPWQKVCFWRSKFFPFDWAPIENGDKYEKPQSYTIQSVPIHLKVIYVIIILRNLCNESHDSDQTAQVRRLI